MRGICGVVCNAGIDGAPLGCGLESGHSGPHSWASLPTRICDRAELESVLRTLALYQRRFGMTPPTVGESWRLLTPSYVRALAIATDELESYVAVAGEIDEGHERQRWAVGKLRHLLRGLPSTATA